MRSAALLIALLSLAACAVSPPLTSRCWNDAIYAYNCARLSGYDARVYTQKTDRSDRGIYHAQARAMIDGEWHWLNVYG